MLLEALFGNTLLNIVELIAAIWVIYDVWAKLRAQTGEKVMWTIAAVLFSIITAIVYYFVKKR